MDELLENASHDVAAAQRGGDQRDYAYQQGVMTGLLRARSGLGGSQMDEPRNFTLWPRPQHAMVSEPFPGWAYIAIHALTAPDRSQNPAYREQELSEAPIG